LFARNQKEEEEKDKISFQRKEKGHKNGQNRSDKATVSGVISTKEYRKAKIARDFHNGGSSFPFSVT